MSDREGQTDRISSGSENTVVPKSSEDAPVNPRGPSRRKLRRVLLILVILIGAMPFAVLESYAFLFRHATKVELVMFNPPPGRTLVLADSPKSARALTGGIYLWPKRHCKCSFDESIIFTTWFGRTEVYASGHTFNFPVFGKMYMEFRMPAGFWKNLQASRTKALAAEAGH